MQAAEMIAGVSGAGGRIVEAEEGLVFAREHGLYVCQDLVAELGTVHVSAEPGQFVAAPAPARHECLACHGRARIAWCSLSRRRLPVSRAGGALLSFCTRQSRGTFSAKRVAAMLAD